MSPQECLQELKQRINDFTDVQMEDLKNFLIQTHASRHQQQTQVASNTVLQGMEQIFQQLDATTIQLLKDKIKETM